MRHAIGIISFVGHPPLNFFHEKISKFSNDNEGTNVKKNREIQCYFFPMFEFFLIYGIPCIGKTGKRTRKQNI